MKVLLNVLQEVTRIDNERHQLLSNINNIFNVIDIEFKIDNMSNALWSNNEYLFNPFDTCEDGWFEADNRHIKIVEQIDDIDYPVSIDDIKPICRLLEFNEKQCEHVYKSCATSEQIEEFNDYERRNHEY